MTKSIAWRMTTRSAGRKYTDEQLERMERMRSAGKMSYEQIAAAFGTDKDDIERQFWKYINPPDNRPLRVPMIDKWNFYGQDVIV